MCVLRHKRRNTHQRSHEIRIRPPGVDLPIRIEVSDVGARGSDVLGRDVAQAEDCAGFLFGPGWGVAGGGGWVGAVLGFVGGGHGVAVWSVVFGMHFGGSGRGW